MEEKEFPFVATIRQDTMQKAKSPREERVKAKKKKKKKVR